MILVSPAMLRYLNDPTPENKARLKPSDLTARDTFTDETMKLAGVRREQPKDTTSNEKADPAENE